MNVNCKIILVSVYTSSIPRITTSRGAGVSAPCYMHLIMIIVSKACMRTHKIIIIEDIPGSCIIYNDIYTSVKIKIELIK